jgi:translation initiation factor IF-3
VGDQVIAKYTRLNEQIRAPRLRVIDSDGKQLGILSRQEALAVAQERELDLVEISPDADPPVCKIVDWGKYNYQRTKQLQKNRKSAKTLDMKQMRFGLKIGAHDLAIKMNKVTKFLEAGHKVKITLFYRGREQAHKEIGFKIAQEVIEDFGDTIIVDQQPQLSGKQLSFVVRSSGKKPTSAPVEVSNVEAKEGES